MNKLVGLHLVALLIYTSNTTHLGALHTALKWFTLPHSPYIMPYAGHLLGGWMDPQYLHVLAFISLQSVCPASSICVLLDSSCIAHIRTCLLVILSALLLTLIQCSLRPHMNCSFTCLSCSWYSHTFTANLTLWSHSSTFSPLCLFI